MFCCLLKYRETNASEYVRYTELIYKDDVLFILNFPSQKWSLFLVVVVLVRKFEWRRTVEAAVQNAVENDNLVY